MNLLSIFPFFQGINELHVVFIFDVVLLLLLLYKVIKNKEFIFSKDVKFILILIWSFSYLLTTIYSPDKELAFLGFLKFFTIPIFLTLIMQYKYTIEEKNKWFDGIAKIGVVMVLIILIVTAFEKIINSETSMFFYQNRLSGFFSYANSFALFLLIGIIITGFKKELKVIDFIVMNLLLIGIILTNSRAITIITVFSYLLILIFNKESRKKNFINLAIMVILGVSISFIMNNIGISNRVLEMNGNVGEFTARLLYYKDALRLIGENIFGYGYMAWWYMQEGFQTGVYDVQFVHNGLLQVAIDAGVIPALLIISIFVIGFFDKSNISRNRVLMFIILGHSLIDFNMEFLAITLVLFMSLEFKNNVSIKSDSKLKLGIGLVGCIYAFFGIVTAFNAVGRYDIGNTMFPYSIALNSQIEEDIDGSRNLELAEKLYEKNKYFVNASFILSQKEQYLENYEKAHEYELWIVKNKKYTLFNYIEYVAFLERAIKYYYNHEDFYTMNKFIDRLAEVPSIIEEVKESSDELAYKIVHKPRLDIPEEMKSYIEEMVAFGEKFKE